MIIMSSESHAIKAPASVVTDTEGVGATPKNLNKDLPRQIHTVCGTLTRPAAKCRYES